eukprot:scaffold43685_cov49-Attheya_sp.AAC.2
MDGWIQRICWDSIPSGRDISTQERNDGCCQLFMEIWWAEKQPYLHKDGAASLYISLGFLLEITDKPTVDESYMYAIGLFVISVMLYVISFRLVNDDTTYVRASKPDRDSRSSYFDASTMFLANPSLYCWSGIAREMTDRRFQFSSPTSI